MGYRKRSLPPFVDLAPPDRYCDLVLTGGVTSAVAYPGVVYGLGQAYRFHAIGGASSGAGIAALAAAAEYRRRHGSSDGFRLLLERADELADEQGGRTRLESLFQPAPGLRALYDTAMAYVAGPGGKWRVAEVFFAAYAAWIVIGVALGICIALGLAAALQAPPDAERTGWWLAGVVGGLWIAVILLYVVLKRDLSRLAEADFGLCSGRRPDESGAPALTDWLHQTIQAVAGKRDDAPLTFGDLHAAPLGPGATGRAAGKGTDRSIDLRMFTADVSNGQPWLLPQDPDDQEHYWFCVTEMRRLFPTAVVLQMVRAGRREAAARGEHPVHHCGSCGGRHRLVPLPRQGLPIVVAARMSVGFPGVFSAVPLWEPVPGGRGVRRILFSDGGLCSNFPIQLFDSPVPAWPTFGVSLNDEASGEGMVAREVRAYLPNCHAEPGPDRWRPIGSGAKGVLDFATAAVLTGKDWSDALQAALPGVRERVVRITIPKGLGGLNVRMKPADIRDLADQGGDAARLLIKRYASFDGGLPSATGWREHRWIRFNLLALTIREQLSGLAQAANAAAYAQPIPDEIARAVDGPPLAGDGEVPLQPAQAAAMQGVLDALTELERELIPERIGQPYDPYPKPELRIRPRL